MKIDKLNIYRGIAILMVFLYHLLSSCFDGGQLPWNGNFRDFSNPPTDNSFFFFYPFTMGHVGVAVFFVISGFCIHISFLQNPTWKSFFVKRFFRIIPPYFLALTIFVLIFPEGIYDIISHYALVHNFFTPSFYAINPSFWSIAIEVQLYLIYPLLTLLLQKFNWTKVLVVVGIIEFGLRSSGWYPAFTTGSPFGYWFSWSIGAYLAHRYVSKAPITFKPFWIVCVILLSILAEHVVFGVIFFFPLSAIATFMILSNMVFKNKEIRRNVVSDHLFNTGIYSYSFYLIHQPIIILWVAFLNKFTNNPLVLMASALPIWVPTYYLSRMSYQYIEQPSIRFGKKALAKESYVNLLKWTFISVVLAASLLLNIWSFYRANVRRGDYLKSREQFALNQDSINHIARRHKAEIYRSLPVNTGAIVFLGNSLMDGLATSEYFPDKKILNRGIEGDKANDIINRLDEITRHNPSKIFLEIGISDIISGTDTAVLLTTLKSIVMTLSRPGTEVYVNSVLPVGESLSVHNRQITEYNRRVENYCEAGHCTFLNLYDKFLTGKILNPEFTYDGLHLTEKGYSCWKRELVKSL